MAKRKKQQQSNRYSLLDCEIRPVTKSDQLNNCLDVSKEGIKVIRISNESNNDRNIVDLNNWNKTYEFIGELK